MLFRYDWPISILEYIECYASEREKAKQMHTRLFFYYRNTKVKYEKTLKSQVAVFFHTLMD